MSTKGINERILDFLKNQDWPVTTGDVANEMKISWNTAQVHLFRLVAESVIRYKKVGRQNQFWLNKNYKKHFQVKK